MGRRCFGQTNSGVGGYVAESGEFGEETPRRERSFPGRVAKISLGSGCLESALQAFREGVHHARQPASLDGHNNQFLNALEDAGEKARTKESHPLLNCRDITELLNYCLPSTIRDENDEHEQTRARHEARPRDFDRRSEISGGWFG